MNRTASLDRDTVEVRWLALDQIGPALWPRLEQILDDTELAQANRFHFERDRNAYVAAHALVRTVLSAHGPCPPRAWRFSAGAHGKPEIVRAAGHPPLRFNISHTRGLVAAAVTLENDVGVDVELIDAARLSLDLAERYFAAREMEQLRRVSVDRRPETMFTFWTLKEAYIKAIGLGLTLPLDAFSYELQPLAIRFLPPLSDDPATWLFRHLKPTPGHALAVALRHASPQIVRVDAQAADPQQLSVATQQTRGDVDAGTSS